MLDSELRALSTGWQTLPLELADSILDHACLDEPVGLASADSAFTSFCLDAEVFHGTYEETEDKGPPRSVSCLDRSAYALVSRAWARRVRAHRFRFQRLASRAKAGTFIQHLDDKYAGRLALPFGTLVQRLELSWEWSTHHEVRELAYDRDNWYDILDDYDDNDEDEIKEEMDKIAVKIKDLTEALHDIGREQQVL